MERGKEGGVHFPSSIFRLVERWAPVLFWMAVVFYFCSRPNPLGSLPSPGQQESASKVAHFAEYAGLLLLLYRALSNSRGGDRAKLM